MFKTSKRLIAVLICLAMVLAALPMAVFAAKTNTIYLQPSDNWLESDAWFAAYFFNNTTGDNTWVKCTAGADGLYSVEVPSGYPNVIFCRMDPAKDAMDWGSKWNQSEDLTVPTNNENVYAIQGWSLGQWIKKGETPDEIPVEYFVRGDFNSWGADAAYKMTDNGDGTYTLTISLAAGTYEYKVGDAGWSFSAPDGMENLSLTLSAEGEVTFTLVKDTKAVTAVGEFVVDTTPVDPDEGGDNGSDDNTTGTTGSAGDNTTGSADDNTTGSTGDNNNDSDDNTTTPSIPTENYFVAGVAELCGSAWDEKDPENQMALNADGLYQKTFTNVPAGSYELKITDGTWTNSWGTDGGNYALDVLEDSDVTVYFNAETKEITIGLFSVGEAPEDPEIPEDTGSGDNTEEATRPITNELSEYYVAGVSGLCGSEWDPQDANNQMFLGTDGLCYKTYKNVAAGTYEFKITKGNWDENWGVDGNNVSFTLDAAEDVTIAFNPATGDIYVLRGDDNVPQFGDVSLAGVAVALLAATCGIVAITKKKEF